MNYIEAAAEQAAKIILASASNLTDKPLPAPIVTSAKDVKNGDFSTSYAMQTAKLFGASPRELAQKIVDGMDLGGSYFETAETAGPGFINLRLCHRWFEDVLRNIASEGGDYGKSRAKRPEKILVEFVSANPTGPMHMGNARGGVLGDSLAEVLSRAGHTVEREFYVNDAGNQIDKFAQSLSARYLQIVLGESAVSFPEDGYQGEDIKALAREFYDIHGGKYANDRDTLEKDIAVFGLSINIPKMKSDLARYNIGYDTWFFESSLYESGEVEAAVGQLAASGKTYEKDGALWLRMTDYGCEKDEVLRRGNGFFTYFAADIAYHQNKLSKRGFDRAINIWGADHHGHVLRLQKALDAIGLDGSGRLEIVIMQMVRLMQNGEVARMSKRTGKAITLSDLLDEISVDAARFFFNSRASDTHLEFDLDLAVKQNSENPVYYVQYAHARIKSIMKALGQDGINTEITSAALDLLTHESELALIRELSRLPEEIRVAAETREPARLNRYAADIGTAMHKFYTECRIKDAGSDSLRDARIFLAQQTATVLKNTLSCFGVTAPEHM